MGRGYWVTRARVFWISVRRLKTLSQNSGSSSMRPSVASNSWLIHEPREFASDSFSKSAIASSGQREKTEEQTSTLAEF